MSGFSALKMAARRSTHGLLCLILRVRSRRMSIAAGPARLVLAPHQDDETLGCGGMIALAAAAGPAPQVVFITDGSASHRRHPRYTSADLIAQRAAEAGEALAILGVPRAQIHMLGAPDGRLRELAGAERAELVRRLADVIAVAAPAEIYLPCRRDGSSEHEAAFDITKTALHLAAPTARVLEYPIWSWWSPRLQFRLLTAPARVWRLAVNAVQARKKQAVQTYRSQLEPLPPLPQPALPPGYADFFLGGVEYYFEAKMK